MTRDRRFHFIYILRFFILRPRPLIFCCSPFRRCRIFVRRVRQDIYCAALVLLLPTDSPCHFRISYRAPPQVHFAITTFRHPHNCCGYMGCFVDNFAVFSCASCASVPGFAVPSNNRDRWQNVAATGSSEFSCIIVPFYCAHFLFSRAHFDAFCIIRSIRRRWRLPPHRTSYTHRLERLVVSVSLRARCVRLFLEVTRTRAPALFTDFDGDIIFVAFVISFSPRCCFCSPLLTSQSTLAFLCRIFHFLFSSISFSHSTCCANIIRFLHFSSFRAMNSDGLLASAVLTVRAISCRLYTACMHCIFCILLSVRARQVAVLGVSLPQIALVAVTGFIFEIIRTFLRLRCVNASGTSPAPGIFTVCRRLRDSASYLLGWGTVFAMLPFLVCLRTQVAGINDNARTNHERRFQLGRMAWNTHAPPPFCAVYLPSGTN